MHSSLKIGFAQISLSAKKICCPNFGGWGAGAPPVYTPMYLGHNILIPKKVNLGWMGWLTSSRCQETNQEVDELADG